jgi:hypothetical protein
MRTSEATMRWRLPSERPRSESVRLEHGRSRFGATPHRCGSPAPEGRSDSRASRRRGRPAPPNTALTSGTPSLNRVRCVSTTAAALPLRNGLPLRPVATTNRIQAISTAPNRPQTRGAWEPRHAPPGTCPRASSRTPPSRQYPTHWPSTCHREAGHVFQWSIRRSSH